MFSLIPFPPCIQSTAVSEAGTRRDTTTGTVRSPAAGMESSSRPEIAILLLLSMAEPIALGSLRDGRTVSLRLVMVRVAL